MLTRRRKSPNSRSKSSLLCGAALLAVLTAVGTARADSADKDDASDSDPCMADAICRAHYNRARKLSKKDDYEGALEAYESAYRRKPVSWLLINLGRSLHKLGRTQDAIQNYQRFLGEKDAKPELKQKAEQFLREAQSDLVNKPAKEPPKKDPAQTDPANPSPGNLPPTASGGPGDKPSVVTSDPALGKGDGKSPAVTSTPSEPVSPPPAPVAPASPPSRLGPLFYGGIAVGGALIVGGVITGIVGLSSASTLNATPYAGPVDASPLPALQSRTRGLGYATDILIPVGVATIAVTTIVSLIRKPAAPTEKPMAPVVAAPSATPPVPSVVTPPVPSVVTPPVPSVVTPPVPSVVTPPVPNVVTPDSAPVAAPNPIP